MALKRITSKDYKHKNVTVTPSFRLDDGTVGEMLYDGEKSGYAVFTDGAWKLLDRMALPNGETLLPYSPKNNLIRNRIVLLPTEPVEYDSEAELLSAIQDFLHGYVDVTPTFERLCAYYVLLTWIYDDFNELPYLRVLGDAGSGKTRFLLTVGSLCYKPIFASGASTVSPLFRILDIFKGTLLIDEGDFRQSDEKAEIVKIFNNGNAKGFPVLRSETTNGKEYNPRAYHVYGPKLIGTRSLFADRALESRCLTEEMGQRRLRDDVPINLPDVFWDEATAIRNRLLMFRFRHVGKHHASPDLVDRSIEPRMNQVFVPLLSIIDDEETLSDLKATMREYHRQYISDKGMDIEGHLLEVIAELREREEVVSVGEIAERFKEKHEDDYDKKINPKWIGSLIRRKLHLKTERRMEGYVIPESEHPKVERLMERFGLKAPESRDERMNMMNVPQESETPEDSTEPTSETSEPSA
ncbi:MAG: hypothetical protein O3A46_00070 [Candidatus Poribacteria bacterium]|nr:hypothetical protein [Candidatus Poribacteria bacterium]